MSLLAGRGGGARSAGVPLSAAEQRPRRRASWACAVVCLVLAVTAVVAVRTLVAVPVRVASASMEPTYAAGDVLLISRRPPQVADLDRGDLVVFEPPSGERTIKRVVGLPGEEVVILDGVLHVDGRPVREPWVDHRTVDGYYTRTFAVPPDHVFVLGDNRLNSIDSRDYGPVPAQDLLGRVITRLWPVG